MKNENNEPTARNFTMGLQAALRQQRLLHGAVKKAGIWRQNQDYDDFLQEAFLAFAQAYVNYPADPEVDECFLGYAYQHIVWRLTDLLRKQRYRQAVPLSDWESWHHVSDDTEMELMITLQELAYDRNSIDQLIIRDHFIKGQSLTTIACKAQLSPRTLRKHRTKLREQLAAILDDTKH